MEASLQSFSSPAPRSSVSKSFPLVASQNHSSGKRKRLNTHTEQSNIHLQYLCGYEATMLYLYKQTVQHRHKVILSVSSDKINCATACLVHRKDD